jgi:hypothetical protein
MPLYVSGSYTFSNIVLSTLRSGRVPLGRHPSSRTSTVIVPSFTAGSMPGNNADYSLHCPANVYMLKNPIEV